MNSIKFIWIIKQLFDISHKLFEKMAQNKYITGRLCLSSVLFCIRGLHLTNRTSPCISPVWRVTQTNIGSTHFLNYKERSSKPSKYKIYNSQITHQRHALYFHFLFFNLYTCFSLYKAIFKGLVIYIYFTSIVYVCYCVIYHM